MDTATIIVVAVLLGFLLFFYLLYLKKKNTINPEEVFTNQINNMGLSESDLTTVFIVEGYFKVNDRKLVTGIVKKGTINNGDTLNYVDESSTLKTTTILGIEKAIGISYDTNASDNSGRKRFKQIVDVANTNDRVGMEIDTNDKILKGTYFFKKD